MSVQGREDKGAALRELLDSVKINPSAVAYMGDDLPDISALEMVGLATCPSDAAKAVLDIADWVSPCAGGSGAVRALSEFILESQGKLREALERYQ
jgi:3-deoxy-D-manno-octulosonate 8-phosphate phosphatase (KDO 8-P phosphatase)